ncbi:MAG: polysaccharide biosynthesis/export family protein [Campylobacterales bacterium]|nr:polysaccharide biosynthesis/export family protein [Campylobacterales bacterium]
MIRFLFPTLFLIFLSGCTTKEYALFQDSDQVDMEAKSSLSTSIGSSSLAKITSRDRLFIEVFNGEKPIVSSGNNTQNYLDPMRGFTVSDDGSVYLPLVGSVHLGGLDKIEASKLLTKKYGEYLRFPYAKVDILNQRVYVLGEVKNPGIVDVTNETLNFFEALAQVGDFTDYANRTDVKIVTYVDGGNPIIKTIDMTDAKSIQKVSLTLKPNDIVYIPPRGIKVYNTYLRETAPLLDTINKLLTPFVNIKYLKD